MLVVVSAEIAAPPVAGARMELGPSPTTDQPMSAWSEVLLRSSVTCELEVIASVAEPTPRTVPVEGERPVFCPPPGATDAKAMTRLVFNVVVRLTFVCAAALMKVTEPLCTTEPSFN